VQKNNIKNNIFLDIQFVNTIKERTENVPLSDST